MKKQKKYAFFLKRSNASVGPMPSNINQLN
jgi:hypothetical protein